MDNLIKNAYNAYKIDNSYDYGSYISIEGANFTSPSFAFDIWFYITGSSSVILSQQDGFSLGISDGGIVLKHPSIKPISLKNNLLKISDNTWNNLYMGFSGSELSFYLNGVSFACASCSAGLRSSKAFLLGEEFTGYIRSFRLYNQTISETDYKNYCFASKFDSKTMPGTVAFIDATAKGLADLSGHSVKAAPHKGCSFMDLTEVYRPSPNEYAYFSNSSHINPGGFSSKKFGVYIKLYVRPGENQRQIIAANGSQGDAGSVLFFAQREQADTNLGVCLGTAEYLFQCKIPAYTWTDFIVSLEGKQITAYINGVSYTQAIPSEFFRTAAGDFTIGGCKNAPGETCEHYLHTVAVFDKALTHEDAADFMENHPFILEDNMIALINFEGGSADELISGVTLCHNKSDLLLAQNTLNVFPDKPYRFRVNYTAQAPSDTKAWEAGLMLTEYQDFGKSMYALESVATAADIAALTNYIAHNTAMQKSISDLYMSFTVTPKNAASALSKTAKPFSKALLQGLQFLTGGSAASTAGTSAITETGLQFLSLFLLGSAAVAATAAIISSSVNNAHKDRPEDDDDDKEKKASISLLSLSLQHTPDQHAVSAIRCRNRNGVIDGAEWTKTAKCVNPAVYIADEVKKVKIRITFKITDVSLKPAEKYNISLSASVSSGENKLFDNFKYEQKNLTANKEYEAELESSISACVAKKFQYSQIELWWSCYINEQPLLMPSTKSDVYIIPTAPCPPISLEKSCPSSLIAVEYLKIFSRMYTKACLKTASPKSGDPPVPQMTAAFDDLKQQALQLYASPNFIYDGNLPDFIKVEPLLISGQYAGQVIKFYEAKFLAAVNSFEPGISSPIAMECEVYAAVLSYQFRLLGLDCRLAYVINPTELSPGRYDKLHMVNVYPAGNMSTPQNPDFAYHVIVEISPQKGLTGMDGVRVFDASMGIMNGGQIEPLAGYSFYGQNTTLVNRAAEPNTYRGLAVRDQTGAIIHTTNYVFVKVKSAE